MRPFYFNGQFAFHHAARGARGVVLCSSFGVEELCTHRLMRELATRLAGVGLPAVRFDYYGTGNSLGSGEELDGMQRWLDGIRHAVQWLREECGVSEVVLVGWRLGALLATVAARDLPEVTHLALIDAPLSGAAYLEQMLSLRSYITQNSRVGASEQELRHYGTSGKSHGVAKTALRNVLTGEIDDVEVGVTAETQLDVIGFRLSATTIAALRQIDLTRIPHPATRRILLLGATAQPNEPRLMSYLQSLGCGVAYQQLPGYERMRWDPTFSDLPLYAFNILLGWARNNMPAGAAHPPRHVTQQLNAPSWREKAVQFGKNNRLFGVLTQPDAAVKQVVLIVNHGANHHIGWARSYVTLSRHLAGMGVAALRMDVSGLGDSPADAGYAENRLFAPESQHDIHAAISWLNKRGFERITLLGHCSGAYLAFQAAVADVRVNDVALVNIPRFFWRPNETVESATRESFQSLRWYVGQLLRLRHWRRFWRRELDLRALSHMLSLKLSMRLQGLWQGARAMLHLPNQPFDEAARVLGCFNALSKRGARVLLLYSGCDGSLDELAMYCGRHGRRLQHLTECQVRIIDDADHNFTQVSAHRQYIHALDEFLYQPLTPTERQSRRRSARAVRVSCG